MTSDWSNFTKKELIDAIHQMEKNPHKKAKILGEFGMAGLGGLGGAATASAFGSSSIAIPIITGITGATITVAAAPFVIGAGAVAGAGAIFGAVQFAKNSGKHEGKRQEILQAAKEKLKEFEQQERPNKVTEEDKIKLYSLLAKAMSLKVNPMDKKDAAELMNAVETEKISLDEAYQLIIDILDGNDDN